MYRQNDSLTSRVLKYTRRRFKQFLVVVLLTIASIAAMWFATNGFETKTDELLINVGTTLAGIVLGYIFVNSILDRISLFPIEELPHFDDKQFIRDVTTSKRQIIIYTTWSAILSDDNLLKDSIPSIRSALLRGVKVQILVLNPYSEAAKDRERELAGEYPPIPVQENIRKNTPYDLSI